MISRMATTHPGLDPVHSKSNTPTGTIYAGGAYRPAAEAAVSVFDHGLLYGDGIFEGLRAYAGRIFKLDRHLERLERSARAVRLALPPRDEIARIVVETCRRNQVVDGYIRLVVTRGAGNLGIDPRSCAQPNLIVIAQPMPPFYGRSAGAAGASLVTAALRRLSPDALSPSIKSLNYLNNVLARMQATDAGADEALLLDAEGYVAEAGVDNIFIVSERGLRTPPTSTNLKGITRETVLELAAELGVAAEEARLTLFDVWTASEVFMCGTGAEIVPVRSVDGRTIGSGGVGPITARIVSAYATLVRSTGTPIEAVATG
jgi:branched-chain amino acid aminotransferase